MKIYFGVYELFIRTLLEFFKNVNVPLHFRDDELPRVSLFVKAKGWLLKNQLILGCHCCTKYCNRILLHFCEFMSQRFSVATLLMNKVCWQNNFKARQAKAAYNIPCDIWIFEKNSKISFTSLQISAIFRKQHSVFSCQLVIHKLFLKISI